MKWWRLSLGVVVMALVVGCGERSATTIWRFALEEIPGSVQDRYAQQFKTLIEAHSGGAIQVEIYPYGALGSSADITEQVRSGALQFAFASPGHLGSVVPEAQIFSLHFLLPEDEQRLQQLLTSSPALYELLGAAYADHQLSLLAIIAEGWMVWSGDRPLRTPADFAGFRMRTMVSPLLVEAYRAYGADPTPLPYGEVYSALQLGMIDGQVNPIFAIEEMRFYQVQEALTFANHLPFVTTLITSPTFLAGLTPQQQQWISSAKAELDSYIFPLQQQFNRERLAHIESSSEIALVTLEASERAQFRQLAQPLHARYRELAGSRGAALLERLQQEMATP